MSKFKVGDRVQVYRRNPARAGVLKYSPIDFGDCGTVVDVPLAPYNAREGYDMVVRMDDGRVGAADSYSWRKIIDRPEAGSWDEICALTHGWRPGVEVHS